MTIKPTALFIGRFQPFHNGHLLVIEGMTKVCGKIFIGIGSSDKKSDSQNPFTAAERKEMIQRALQGRDLIPMFDINFVELPDTSSDEAWRELVLSKVEKIDKVWSGDERTKKCFEGVIEIQNIRPVPGISDVEILGKMKSRINWQDQLPKEVVSYIQEIDALDRLQT